MAELVARVAALDIGKAWLTACVRAPHETRPGTRRQEIRTFATTTRSPLELQDWLVAQDVSLCVMEATSTYWKPPFYLLEDVTECWVVNARDVKNDLAGCGVAVQAGRAGDAAPASNAAAGDTPDPWRRPRSLGDRATAPL